MRMVNHELTGDRPGLTRRQQAVLLFVRRYLAAHGMPPTGQEVATEFGFSVRASAHEVLKVLEQKGYLTIRPGAARGLKLVDDDVAGHEDRGLPLIGAIAAGAPILASENIEAWVSIGPDLFRPAADFLHRVEGNSMNRIVLDGDLVGIRLQPTAENGQVIAAAMPDRDIGGELITLKRYALKGSTVTLTPASTDARYKPFEIDLSAGGPDSQDRAPFRIVGVLCSGLFRGSAIP